MAVISKIESAINRVCEEINRSPYKTTWHSTNEEELLFELISCILGSRVSYEIAQTAAKEIRQSGLLELPTYRFSLQAYQDAIENVLRRPLRHIDWLPKARRYPFPKLRANHISRTVWAIYSTDGSIKNLLKSSDNPKDARRTIVQTVVGVGPKQASLFLRNIGFTAELAILDSHVLRFMGMHGLIENRVRSVPSLKVYEKHETNLLKYARWSGWSLGCLDQAIWIVMRVYLREAMT